MTANNETIELIKHGEDNGLGDLKEIHKHKSENKKDMAKLFGKMAKVMNDVERVPKSGWNSFHKYNYPTETDLLGATRKILAEHGIAFFANVLESSNELRFIYDKYQPNNEDKMKKKWFSEIKMEYTLGCTETGATIVSCFNGQAEDDSDKAYYKAYTNTLKYFLRQTFLIETGDTDDSSVDGQPMDVEYHNNEQRPQNGAQGKNNNNQRANQPKNDPDGGIEKSQLVGKWKLLGGDEGSFEEFYNNQRAKNKTHVAINKFLDGKIVERNAKAEGEPDEGKAEKEDNRTEEQKENGESESEGSN